MSHYPTILIVLVMGLFQSPARAEVRIQSAWVAMSANGGIASSHEQRVLQGTPVQLYLVVEAKLDGKTRIYSDAPRLKKNGRIIGQRRIERWPKSAGPLTIQWQTIEPSLEIGVYDNTGTFGGSPHGENESHPARWHWCPIDYVEHTLSWGSVWRHVANARPREAPDHYDGLGTMRYGVTLQYRGQTVETPGVTDRDKGGLRQSVATIRVRKDNTEVGYMTELLNVPYVYGSASLTGQHRHHQAERATGTDCADLIVYGWRRAGRKIKYTWSQGLKSHTRLITKATYSSRNTYRNDKNMPIQFGQNIRVGDILLWGRHVAIVTEKDPTNRLSPNTKILHTVWGSPAMVPLKEIGFGFDKSDFEIRRLKNRN